MSFSRSWRKEARFFLERRPNFFSSASEVRDSGVARGWKLNDWFKKQREILRDKIFNKIIKNEQKYEHLRMYVRVYR